MISGIILAGGESKRMGVDKRSLLLGKESLLSIAIGKMRKVADEVIVVVAKGDVGVQNFEPLQNGVRIVQDTEMRKGPLVGLLSGLQKMTHAHGLVIPCDLPFIPLNLIRYLLDHTGERPAIVPRWGGRIHPFPGIYSRSLIPKLLIWKTGGDLSLTRFLLMSGVYVRWVDEEEIPGRVGATQLGLHSHLSLFNINTQEDLKIAQNYFDEELGIYHRLLRYIAERSDFNPTETGDTHVEKGGKEWLRKEGLVRRVNTQNHPRPTKSL